MENIPIFDTLTHFVTSDGAIKITKPLGIEGYTAYTSGLQNPNVKAIGLFTGACPKYQKDGEEITPLKWDLRNGRIEESTYKTIDGIETRMPVMKSCYADVNEILLKESKKMSGEHLELSLFYAPIIHPKRTSIADLEKILSEGKESILGFKVHGISTASGPNDFNPDLAKYIASTGIPLIIHTDYNNQEFPSELLTPRDAMQYLQGINNPKDWTDFCLKHEIRASLQHGARNDKNVYKIIKDNHGQFVVGLGPMIDGNSSRMVTKTDNYIASIFENLGPEHVTFSTDYPFNKEGEDLTKEVESLSVGEQKQVFYQNAENFFGIKKI